MLARRAALQAARGLQGGHPPRRGGLLAPPMPARLPGLPGVHLLLLQLRQRNLRAVRGVQEELNDS